MPGEASRRNGQRGGRPRGRLGAKTLDKLAAREQTREIITAALTPLLQAQIANALGLKYLVTRDKKTGKFVRVTEAMAKLKAQLAPNEEIIEVWEKDPSVQAFTDLLNRALDKPKEQPQDLHVSGSVDVVAILKERQTRRLLKA